MAGTRMLTRRPPAPSARFVVEISEQPNLGAAKTAPIVGPRVQETTTFRLNARGLRTPEVEESGKSRPTRGTELMVLRQHARQILAQITPMPEIVVSAEVLLSDANGVRLIDGDGRSLWCPVAEWGGCGDPFPPEAGASVPVVALGTNVGQDVLCSHRRATRAHQWERLIAAGEGANVRGQIVALDEQSVIIDIGVPFRRRRTAADLKHGEAFTGTVAALDERANKVTIGLSSLSTTQQLEAYSVGDRLEVMVVEITDFGVFGSDGNMTGLIHKSEVSWGLWSSDSTDGPQLGDRIEVEIAELDRDRGRVSLSRKRVLPHPFDSFCENYSEGDEIDGRVENTVDYGVFVDLGDFAGLLHYTQIPDCGFREAKEMFTVGHEIRVSVLSIDHSKKRIGLTMLLDDE